jgi:meso-butanediol dehydrogenase/(S,S)-butanediol dehydrogenase/diacetyl reductase
MSGPLAGQVALVTGAGRAGGLGQAIARALAARGASVLLHDRGAAEGALAPAHGVGTADELAATAEAIRAATGARVETVTGDLRDESAIAAIVAAAADRFGRLDILVNNAGIGYLFGALTGQPTEEIDAVLAVNLRAPMLLIKHAAPVMISGGRGGRILNIASQAGKSGFAFAVAYTASKHGLIGLTRASALELAPHGITVNAICPNHVTTGLGAWQNGFMARAQGRTVDEYLAAMRARIPLGRTGTPEDTAAVAAFLCLPEAGYITAEAINVSGGEEYH